MGGIIDTQPYLNIFKMDGTCSLGPDFAREDVKTDAVRYTRVQTMQEEERVVPTAYQNCLGLLILLMDVVIALAKKCFCKAQTDDEIPQGSYELKKETVRFVESRRNAKRSEEGVEFAALVEKVRDCVREVRSSFSLQEANEVALQVARNWKVLNQRIASQGISTLTSSFSAGVDLRSGLQKAANERGFYMPEIIMERDDEIRNKKLHHSTLTVKLPVRESGVDSDVVLYRSVVVGAEQGTTREFVSQAQSKEGFPIELENSESAIRTRLRKVVGSDDIALLDAMLDVIKNMKEALVPLAGTMSLYRTRDGKGQPIYTLQAQNFLMGRLKTATEAGEVEGQELAQCANSVLASATSRIGTSPFGNIQSEVVRPPHSNTWAMRISFSKKD